MSSQLIASPRMLSATGLALVVTLALFYIMTVLIRGDDTLEIFHKPTMHVDWMPVLEDEPVTRKPRQDPPPPVQPPPVTPRTKVTDEMVTVGVEWTDPGISVGGEKPTIGVSDGEAVPLVTSAPDYPPRAITQGIQGWVIVEFAIDPQGRVFAPHVVEGQPAGIFDRAALNAITRYKYKPRVINGEAVSVEGIRQRIVFELEG